MLNRMLTLALIWLLLAGLLFGQPGNQIFSASYGLPLLAPVAPGQVVTLFIRGLKAGPASASTLPLPTTLAGVSVSLKQPDGFSGPAPIFRILQSGSCRPRLRRPQARAMRP